LEELWGCQIGFFGIFLVMDDGPLVCFILIFYFIFWGVSRVLFGSVVGRVGGGQRGNPMRREREEKENGREREREGEGGNKRWEAAGSKGRELLTCWLAGRQRVRCEGGGPSLKNYGENKK